MSTLQRKTDGTERFAFWGRVVPLRRGLNAVEVVVVLAILALMSLCLAMILPRRRETARLVTCQRNLMQIGTALVLYDQSQGSLPSVPELGSAEPALQTGPLKSLLVELGIPDLTALNSPENQPPKQPNLAHQERRVPGFVCASDSHAIGGILPAPVSYRATTGDVPDGRNGAFAPGRHIGIPQIEAAEGSSYTAGFAERLVGDNRPEHPAASNFAVAPHPLPAAGCPPSAPSAWRGDAGASWVASNWQSTLYNHAQTPNASPSCIADDRRAAFMGASSGHVDGVNVLFFDGSVRTFTSQVDPKIWRGWATVPEAPRDPPKLPTPIEGP